jgi:hypothetical protein
MMDFIGLFLVVKKELGPIEKGQEFGGGETRE